MKSIENEIINQILQEKAEEREGWKQERQRALDHYERAQGNIPPDRTIEAVKKCDENIERLNHEILEYGTRPTRHDGQKLHPTERKNQIDKEIARSRAADYWKLEPQLTLSKMVQKIQHKQNHDGKPLFSRGYKDRTITEWIRDLNPAYSEGTPGAKKKSA